MGQLNTRGFRRIRRKACDGRAADKELEETKDAKLWETNRRVRLVDTEQTH